MGDTLNETPPTRRDKPQSLNISQDELDEDADSANLANRSPRSRELNSDREREREREHSCDGLSSSSKRSTEFVGLVTPPRRESLNSCEPQRQQAQIHSPSAGGLSSNLNKALGLSNRATSTAGTAGGASSSRYSSSVVVGGGIGNLAGTTTRKCVLTLDGYSYVIVASTPETLPSKRDEGNIGAGGSSCSGANNSSGSNNNNSNSATAAGGAATGEATAPDNGIQSPTSCDLGNATINGQVAKHGSLTIVRRSNSRKNFTQIDGQTQSIVASPSSASISFFQAPLSEPLAERLSGRSTNGSSTFSAADKRAADYRSEGAATATSGKSSVGRMQPSSPNQSNFVTDTRAPSAEQSENMSHEALDFSQPDNYGNPIVIDHSSQHSMESDSNQSVAGQWGTDNLPQVDTADALNKAALRIRSLLRRMDQETVAYEDMQRNLHYAARVLEAVFIDESRSPTSGKSKLGQIASSSVENEDEPGKQRCNGKCKNLNNNNTNSSCELHKGAATEDTTPTSAAAEDQTSIESRTKGVSQAPQTHSGPTGPPIETEVTSECDTTKPLETVMEAAQEDPTTTTTETTTMMTTTTTTTTETTSSGNAEQSVSSSSSCSNKATVQRQRRLRTPIWARSMSTNKTYLMVLY